MQGLLPQEAAFAQKLFQFVAGPHDHLDTKIFLERTANILQTIHLQLAQNLKSHLGKPIYLDDFKQALSQCSGFNDEWVFKSTCSRGREYFQKQDLQNLAKSYSIQCNDQQLQKIFMSVDRDKDRRVTQQEFLNALRHK